MLAVPPGSFLREGILKVGLEAALGKSRRVSVVPPSTAPAPGSPGPGGAGGAAAPGAARWGETLLEGAGGTRLFGGCLFSALVLSGGFV